MSRILFSVVLIGLLIYFAFHAVYGNRGLISYIEFNNNVDQSLKKLYKLKAERLELEQRVNLLRLQSLDLDMLDEQVRKKLGLAHSNEKIFSVNKDLATN
ncbi:FtsB family cell division protein [Orientia tsutsugamushi]|uniref:Cell division protein FtsB n=5 Tax=Orientia tsutsugamushi TaxID=784 RepID=A0A0F3MEZ7_ORITS|nr:septum formation initiator family protein [Orientia tsutsugamushi]KJV74788.1 septum formation initiator family protein [Orientia tsutsugamushi str. TA763]KJV53119.1 septum formation initiator family protein [Orientia tsutsugamushi str. Gilliam]KJV54085.1 septum formation initiator family protein [Orientia tsutsugamushi str. Gilliam]KJV55129.1 septum formation initiator family protein [Orientia tsutsugamushi str. Kato PP]KJV55873.1 septum formation initiator family protein [Orientia tsutsuga